MMAKVTIFVLVSGLLCVYSQLVPKQPGDDATAAGGADSGLRPGLTMGKDPEYPRKTETGTQDQFNLVDTLENETESKRPEGERYTWEHDLGTGETVSERAFAPNGSKVIIVKSRDRALEAYNITRSTSVYSFSDYSSLVAIIPWRRSGPCLVRNTNLTYPAAIDLLTARNGSRVQTLSKVVVDGNVAPLSTEETTTFFQVNPSLRRACGLRQIIITTEIGENSTPYSNSTEQIVTFNLEAEVTITVPERPEVPETNKNADGTSGSGGRGNRWGAKNY